MKKNVDYSNPRVNAFGTNEQSEIEVDVVTYIELAKLVLARENIMISSEMSLIFCDEEEISSLNKAYMDKDGPTDVLAFPIDDDLVGVGRNPDNGGRGPGTPSEAMAYLRLLVMSISVQRLQTNNVEKTIKHMIKK